LAVPEPPPIDVIVIGGGPAGWSAALLLGRARRGVLLIDDGQPRNRASPAVHAFLTREGTPPLELLSQASSEALKYPSVQARRGRVAGVSRDPGGFHVTVDDGTRYQSRKILLATGVVDELPPIAGIERCYGRSVHHCPYCDGWEHRDQPLAVYGRGDKGIGLALMLTLWSADVALCTDGRDEAARAAHSRLQRQSVALREQAIERVEADDRGNLQALVFADGTWLARRALFFNTGCRAGSLLHAALGCEIGERGSIRTDPLTEESSVPGIYAAGDASRDVLLVIVAAAEGAKAAVAINKALLKEEGRF
jgi:thioredoxin reductase